MRDESNVVPPPVPIRPAGSETVGPPTTTTPTFPPVAPPERERTIPFAPPSVGVEEIAEVIDSLRSHWITTGPKTKAFEAAFGTYLGTPADDAMMVSSCTAALQIALAVHGIGPGDEILVPTLTFASTAHVVEHAGARPIFVDVLPDTLCIDPEAAEHAVTPATRAIIPVHYAGHPAPMDAIDHLAERYGLAVIEDAAHALPATYRGTRIGARSNFAAFSFYATKNLTTAEGGALTGSPDLLERARPLALHGMSRDAWKRYGVGGSWSYDVVAAGFKSNMTDLQAALGLQQLKKLDGFQARRRSIVDRYDAAFAHAAAFETPIVHEDVESALHLYVLRLQRERLQIDRNAFIGALAERGIGASVHFLPLHMTSFYQGKYGLADEAFPVARDAYERMMSLPLHPALRDDDVQYVTDTVMHLAQRHAA